jgi:hypothetical protein
VGAALRYKTRWHYKSLKRLQIWLAVRYKTRFGAKALY